MATEVALRPTDHGSEDYRPSCPGPDPVKTEAEGSISEILPTAKNKRKQTDGYVSASDESDESESDEDKKKDESAKPKPKKAKPDVIAQDDLHPEDEKRTDELIASVIPQDESPVGTQPLDGSDEDK